MSLIDVTTYNYSIQQVPQFFSLNHSFYSGDILSLYFFSVRLPDFLIYITQHSITSYFPGMLFWINRATPPPKLLWSYLNNVNTSTANSAFSNEGFRYVLDMFCSFSERHQSVRCLFKKRAWFFTYSKLATPQTDTTHMCNNTCLRCNSRGMDSVHDMKQKTNHTTKEARTIKE